MNENNKDISATIRRAERFQVILIGEGIIVGGIAGLVVLLYRILLENAGRWLQMILNFIEGRPLWILLWFGVLALLAILVAKLVDFEPLISGSGIPQLEGEMIGKIVRGRLLMYPGRPGPGAGGPVHTARGHGGKRSLPVSGQRKDRGEVSSHLRRQRRPGRGFPCAAGGRHVLPGGGAQEFLGVCAFVGHVSLTHGGLSVHGCAGDGLGLSVYADRDAAFGVLWASRPSGSRAGLPGRVLQLGTGHSLVEELTAGGMAAGTMAFLLVGRFLFSAVSFGSGAPGGIFFPLLIIGAFIGGIFAQAGNWIFGIDLLYLNNFVLLAMAGYFTAIVRAPLTGIILIFEMTGTVSQLFSLAVVSICAYIVATLMRSKPIYESLLANLLKKRGEPLQESGEKVLREFVVSQGSDAAGKLVRELEWPRESLLVAVKRGDRELIPRGSTRLYPGDSLVVMADEYDTADVIGQMERLCSE